MATKIYFAGSIRGGRDDVEWYAQIVDILRRYGRVLSEHVASLKEERLSDRQIFQQDLHWIRESDAIVAEVTTPSLGVGYELGYAEALKIPALCLFQEQPNKRLSAMITGSLYFENNVVEYKKGDLAELEKLIDNFFSTSVVVKN